MANRRLVKAEICEVHATQLTKHVVVKDGGNIQEVVNWPGVPKMSKIESPKVFKASLIFTDGSFETFAESLNPAHG